MVSDKVETWHDHIGQRVVVSVPRQEIDLRSIRMSKSLMDSDARVFGMIVSDKLDEIAKSTARYQASVQRRKYFLKRYGQIPKEYFP